MGAGAAWWAFLYLCPLVRGQDHGPGLAPSPPARCEPGRFLHREADVLRCCSLCNSSTKPCPSNQLRDCTCARPGEFCEDSDCSKCKRHICLPGQQVLIHGTFLFGFSCKDCEDGTYSNGMDDKCLPWTDCSREGFVTVRPGNRTHNVLCGMALLPESGLFDSSSILAAILIGLTTVTVMLVVVQLVLHFWWAKKEPSPKDREPILPLGPGPPDDIGNCPFPEEEWGEKTAEEKAEAGHPWV
ncbi:tumor necrosis factor receptor superfamily member 18 [Sarcophilus harrisii]|uniref:TNF receptor superfamily member 18 n=1 Tax=Sarcophilus harrisii TaxID=9305 RepID=A0A7N4PVQ8_SARHA|nr:tumor necrosis factor receptor superfamily member 18 [Sarcophilus harrisii]